MRIIFSDFNKTSYMPFAGIEFFYDSEAFKRRKYLKIDVVIENENYLAHEF